MSDQELELLLGGISGGKGDYLALQSEDLLAIPQNPPSKKKTALGQLYRHQAIVCPMQLIN